MAIQNAVRTISLLSLLLTTSLLSAAGRPLAPPQIAETSYPAFEPATAFAGDRFLTIWKESMGLLDHHVRGAFSDAAGRRLSEKSFVIELPVRPALWLAFFGVGDRYILFHTNQISTSMTELDRDGRVVAHRAVDLPPHHALKIVWAGTRFVAASPLHPNYTEIFLLDRSGDRLLPPVSLVGGEYGIEVARAGDTVLVAATGRTGTYLHSLRRDGTFDTRLLVQHDVRHPVSVVLTETPHGGAIAVWSQFDGLNSGLWVQELARGGAPIEIPVLAHFAPGTITALELLRAGNSYIVVYRYQSAPDAHPSLHAVRVVPGASSGPGLQLSESVVATAGASGDNIAFVAFQAKSIHSVAIDANGLVQHDDVLSLSPARQSQPALTAIGGQYVAAWTELTGHSASTHSADVAPDGEPGATSYPGPQALASRELAPSGGQVLALQVDGNRLLARRLTFDGAPVASMPNVLGTMFPYYRASATWLRDRWLVAWPEHGSEGSRSLRLATITADGAGSPARTLALETPVQPNYARSYESLTLTSDGQHALLVWTERHVTPCWFPTCDPGYFYTFAVRLTSEGEILDAPLKLNEGDLVGLAAASNGRNYFVALDRSARLLDVQNGALRIASSFELFNWHAGSDVTWDGREYVVAMRYLAAHWYVATRRFDDNGTEVGTLRGTRTLRADDFAPPSVASVFANDSLIAVQEGDAADGVRAVVYRERDFATLPAAPLSPRNVRSEPVGDGVYEVTWDAPPGPPAELYLIEARYESGWFVLTSTTELHALVRWGPLRVRALNAGGISPETDPIQPSMPRRRAVRR